TSPSALASLNLAGTLTGLKSVAISGLFTWGGSLSGTGTVTAAGGIANAAGTLDGYTLINPAGQTALLTGSIVGTHGAAFSNAVALVKATSIESDIFVPLTNAGTLDTGPGRIVIPAAFANSGTVQGTWLSFPNGTFASSTIINIGRIDLDGAA